MTYERFTDRARKVMQLAQREAQRFNHEYIGTEHILLGLISESGAPANVLMNLDVDPRKIRLEVEKLIQSGPEMVTMGKLPQTPRAKMVIAHSLEEASSLNHSYVGTEHILLGLLHEQHGVAAQVLMNLGLKLEGVREEVRRMCGQEQGAEVGGLGSDVRFIAWIERQARRRPPLNPAKCEACGPVTNYRARLWYEVFTEDRHGHGDGDAADRADYAVQKFNESMKQ